MAISKIYLLAPANVYTGGPTAIHQLCYSINKTFYDIECSMAYTGVKSGIDPVCPEYKKYKLNWVPISKVEDSSENLVIFPETQTNLLYGFKFSRRAIYWLSVDNFILSGYYRSNRYLRVIQTLLDVMEYVFRYTSIPRSTRYKLSFGDISHYLASREVSRMLSENLGCVLKLLNNADLHIAQSEYARNFLTYVGVDKHRIPILREPIEEDFCNGDSGLQNKDNIISFNARKTFSITYRIINKVRQYNKNIRVVSLGNVGKEGMIKILSKSKVFIDIGHHPGRDRPAREAGALGNVVIINRSGGYYHFEDMPVPDQYTIHCEDMAHRDVKENHLVNLIVDAVENYEQHIKNFIKFREYVTREEPKLYLEDLRKLKTLIEQL